MRKLYWSVALGFLLVIPLPTGWSLPPVVAGTSYLVTPLVIVGGMAYTRQRTPLAAVAAMVTMVFVQLMAWFSLLN